MLTLGGKGGSKKVKMLTVVDGRREGRVESKIVKVLLLIVEGVGGLNKIQLFTVVEGRKGRLVKKMKTVHGC